MSDKPAVDALHHITLSVTDLAASALWYQRLLGDAMTADRQGPGWTRLRMEWPTGIIIVLTRHESTAPHDAFDHTRVGLDHVALSCPDEAAVRNWAALMDAEGIEHGPVEDVAYGWVLTARDPDCIPLEFFCRRA
jgi:glyoxylase I family protein